MPLCDKARRFFIYCCFLIVFSNMILVIFCSCQYFWYVDRFVSKMQIQAFICIEKTFAKIGFFAI